MAIPRTKIHLVRVVDQIRQNLVGLQRDMAENAAAHRAMALAQSPALSVLQGFLADCVTEYLRRLQWVIDLRNDPTKEARLLAVITLWGWTEDDIVDVVTALRQVAIGLRDAPRTTYAQIVTACEAVLAACDPPDSLWPE